KPDEAAVSLPADLDGQSFLTLLSGGGPSIDRNLIWHFPYYHPERGYAKAPDRIGINDFFTSRTHPHSALRRGNHKLIWFHEDSRTELYDLESDPSEQHDLSEIKSPLRDQLLEELQRNLQAMHARFATPSAPALRK
ncbi:MAG: DUF4976 domain-containing protein, partial [Planctomycetaceae bacterium]|nr:DUF4976 domain-containing protein [Planctomycetaceae bacterium]